MSEWLNVLSASRKAHVSDRTIRNWIKSGKLVAKKEKGIWLIDPDSMSEIGNDDFRDKGKSEDEIMISVPLYRYESLITRLAQLESENQDYRLMLQAPKENLWAKILRKIGIKHGKKKQD